MDGLDILSYYLVQKEGGWKYILAEIKHRQIKYIKQRRRLGRLTKRRRRTTHSSGMVRQSLNSKQFCGMTSMLGLTETREFTLQKLRMLRISNQCLKRCSNGCRLSAWEYASNTKRKGQVRRFQREYRFINSSISQHFFSIYILYSILTLKWQWHRISTKQNCPLYYHTQLIWNLLDKSFSKLAQLTQTSL